MSTTCIIGTVAVVGGLYTLWNYSKKTYYRHHQYQTDAKICLLAIGVASISSACVNLIGYEYYNAFIGLGIAFSFSFGLRIVFSFPFGPVIISFPSGDVIIYL